VIANYLSPASRAQVFFSLATQRYATLHTGLYAFTRFAGSGAFGSSLSPSDTRFTHYRKFAALDSPLFRLLPFQILLSLGAQADGLRQIFYQENCK
jgi:hypothetical protein